jgi:uncharacterized protein YebE (UPF0316 family)
MPLSDLMNSELYTWVIIPLLIFCARVVDVSFGTIRIVYISRGKKTMAPLLAFLEIIVWLLAIGQIFKNLNNIACYLAYAAGFATGNYVGIWLENKLAIGTQVLRIITSKDATNLIQNLREEGYGLTIVPGEGQYGPVKIIFTIIKRRDYSHVVELIQKHNPKAFYSLEDVRLAREGIFPGSSLRERKSNGFPWIRMDRKGK